MPRSTGFLSSASIVTIGMGVVCERCRHPIVELTVQGLSQFALRSCTSCDRRTWVIDGKPSSVGRAARAMDSQRHLLRTG